MCCALKQLKDGRKPNLVFAIWRQLRGPLSGRYGPKISTFSTVVAFMKYHRYQPMDQLQCQKFKFCTWSPAKGYNASNKNREGRNSFIAYIDLEFYSRNEDKCLVVSIWWFLTTVKTSDIVHSLCTAVTDLHLWVCFTLLYLYGRNRPPSFEGNFWKYPLKIDNLCRRCKSSFFDYLWLKRDPFSGRIKYPIDSLFSLIHCFFIDNLERKPQNAWN